MQLISEASLHWLYKNQSPSMGHYLNCVQLILDQSRMYYAGNGEVTFTSNPDIYAERENVCVGELYGLPPKDGCTNTHKFWQQLCLSLSLTLSLWQVKLGTSLGDQNSLRRTEDHWVIPPQANWLACSRQQNSHTKVRPPVLCSGYVLVPWPCC